MTELKPCPFCGCKKATILYDEKYKRYSVLCGICSARISTTSAKRQDTIEAWNRRVGDNE